MSSSLSVAHRPASGLAGAWGAGRVESRAGARQLWPSKCKVYVHLQQLMVMSFIPTTKLHGHQPPPKGKGMVNGQQQRWGLREVLTHVASWSLHGPRAQGCTSLSDTVAIAQIPQCHCPLPLPQKKGFSLKIKTSGNLQYFGACFTGCYVKAKFSVNSSRTLTRYWRPCQCATSTWLKTNVET